MLTFTYDDVAGATDAYDQCHRLHLQSIEHDWFFANIPTGSERDAMFNDLISCLEEGGFSGMTPTLTKQAIVDQIVAQADSDDSKLADGFLCMDRHIPLFPEGMYETG